MGEPPQEAGSGMERRNLGWGVGARSRRSSPGIVRSKAGAGGALPEDLPSQD